MIEPIRLLIVDDVPRVRQGLRELLPLAGEAAGLRIEVVGEAANGHDSIAQCLALSPDVVLMDLEMPEMDGLAATRALKASRPRVRVVALTVHGGPADRQRALEAGVDELVEKGAPMAVLVPAIRGCDRGERKG